MKRFGAFLLALLVSGISALAPVSAADSPVPANVRVQVHLTPSGFVDTGLPDGDDGTAGLGLKWAPIPTISCNSGASCTYDFAAQLTQPGSPNATFSVLGCTLPVGWSLNATSGVASHSGSGSATAVCQVRATRSAVTVDTNLFSISSVAVPGTDTLAPTIPKGLIATSSAGSIFFQLDRPSDPHDGTNPGTGLAKVELLKNGSHLTDITTAAGISLPLTQTIFGTFSPAAASVQTGSSYALTAAGAGFHNTAGEEGIFRGAPVTGDFELTSCISSFRSAFPYSTAGPQVRETLSLGSKFIFEYQQPDSPGNGVQIKSRVETGGLSANVATYPTVDAPSCQKIARVGSVFNEYYSANALGVGWVLAGTQTAPWAATVYAGVAMSSQNPGVPETATFDQVSITQGGVVTYNYSTTGASATYTAKAYDAASTPNVSAVSGSVTAAPLPSGTADVKWHPGHYVLGETVSKTGTLGYSASFIQSLPSTVTGYEQRVSWELLEPTRGNYNLAPLDALVAICKAAGKRVIIQLFDRSFSDGSDISSPAYLATEISGGGVYHKPPGGYVPKYYNPAITDRLIALYQAIGAHFDPEPYLEGVFTGESDLGQGSASDPNFSATGYVAQLQRTYAAVIPSYAHTNFWANLNFLPTNRTDMQTMVAYLVSHRIGLVVPDVTTCGADCLSWGQHVANGFIWNGTAWTTVGGTNYVGQMALATDIEDLDLGEVGGPSADQVYQQSHNFNHDNHAAWVRKNYPLGTDKQLYFDNTKVTLSDPPAGHWTPDILGYLTPGTSPTWTGCPSYYSGCDTSALIAPHLFQVDDSDAVRGAANDAEFEQLRQAA